MKLMATQSSTKAIIIIPAYNEEACISEVLRLLRKSIQNSRLKNIDILLVDDGSSDETVEIARKHHIRIIRHIINSGAGAATATGLAYAKQNGYGIAATMDADGQHSPEDVIHGIELMMRDSQEGDLLIGSRLIDSNGMSRVKIIGNRGLSFITYLLFGVRVTDSQSGLRIFSRRAINRLFWKTNGYEFCSEMLWRAKQQKLTVSEYSIEAIYTDYSVSKGQNNWNALNILKSLVKHRVTEMFE